MRISYRAVYQLMDRYYARKSLNGLINDDMIAEGAFQASLVFAHREDLFEYLEIMVQKRKEMDQQFVFFLNADGLPIVIDKDKPLSILEFAILSMKCEKHIHVSEFEGVVEAQADNRMLPCEEYIGQLTATRALLKGIISPIAPTKN